MIKTPEEILEGKGSITFGGGGSRFYHKHFVIEAMKEYAEQFKTYQLEPQIEKLGHVTVDMTKGSPIFNSDGSLKGWVFKDGDGAFETDVITHNTNEDE